MKEANRTYHEAQSQMELLPNYYAWTYRIFRPYLHGTVVELGCGAGLGISSYLPQVEEVYAVDHDEDLLRRVRDTLPENRVHTTTSDLTGDWRELDGISADMVLLVDVLEHFADDRELLRKASKLLKPGGHIAIKVPAGSRAYSAMDRASGHYRRYDPGDIEALAEELSLRIVRLKQVNPLGGIAYRLKNRQSKNFSRSFPRFQLRLINFAIPAIRQLDLLPFLPSLSLCVVLRNCE